MREVRAQRASGSRWEIVHPDRAHPGRFADAISREHMFRIGAARMSGQGGLVDDLVSLVESVGGTVTLCGKQVTARELKSFAWAGFVERYADVVARAACTAMAIPRETQWSPYP